MLNNAMLIAPQSMSLPVKYLTVRIKPALITCKLYRILLTQ